MSTLTSTLQAFFTDRLLQQHHASPHTVAAYRDAWKLLVGFAADHLGKSALAPGVRRSRCPSHRAVPDPP